jgi:hypothetical protein
MTDAQITDITPQSAPSGCSSSTRIEAGPAPIATNARGRPA